MEAYSEPAREIPVVREAGVIVVGGGPAGLAAAIASARNAPKANDLSKRDSTARLLATSC